MKKDIESTIYNLASEVLKNKDTYDYEKEILVEFLDSKDVFTKKVLDLKNSILKIQIEMGIGSGLSKGMLNFYSEVSRLVPTTGPSSIFNRFIKK